MYRIIFLLITNILIKENILVFKLTSYFKFTSYFFYLNTPLVLEYDLDYSRWGKTQIGFASHLNIIPFQNKL